VISHRSSEELERRLDQGTAGDIVILMEHAFCADLKIATQHVDDSAGWITMPRRPDWRDSSRGV
jgi:hypothetical protein